MRRALLAACAVLALTSAGFAQDADPPQAIPFEGGTFIIGETDDLQKVLTYDGQEIARNYQLFLDRTVKIGEVNVALFTVGDGGNACGAQALIAWKPEGGTLQNVVVGDECDGAPPASVSDDRISFIPFLAPGDTKPLMIWSPEDRLRTAGDLSFTPQPDTTWDSFDGSTLQYVIDAFDNAAVYEAAKATLGANLSQVVSGLFTGGEIETQPDGILTAYGCVPHACGVSDSFMAIDPKGRKLYFAQQDSNGGPPKAWPALDAWPEALKTVMGKAILGQQ